MATTKKTMEIIARGIEREDSNGMTRRICTFRIPAEMLGSVIDEIGDKKAYTEDQNTYVKGFMSAEEIQWLREHREDDCCTNCVLLRDTGSAII